MPSIDEYVKALRGGADAPAPQLRYPGLPQTQLPTAQFGVSGPPQSPQFNAAVGMPFAGGNLAATGSYQAAPGETNQAYRLHYRKPF